MGGGLLVGPASRFDLGGVDSQFGGGEVRVRLVLPGVMGYRLVPDVFLRRERRVIAAFGGSFWKVSRA